MRRLENTLNNLGDSPLRAPGPEATNLEDEIDRYYDLVRKILESLRFKG